MQEPNHEQETFKENIEIELPEPFQPELTTFSIISARNEVEINIERSDKKIILKIEKPQDGDFISIVLSQTGNPIFHGFLGRKMSTVVSQAIFNFGYTSLNGWKIEGGQSMNLKWKEKEEKEEKKKFRLILPKLPLKKN
ncbi:MAG: hypothetical protein IT416_03950 [Candidatus Pacebacteria bacterium]|nr:hypothetical protein [Candidatus Paceibacterota bacterium]